MALTNNQGHVAKAFPRSRLMYWTRHIGRKVPEVAIYFWVIKILTTAMGEATSDYMVHRIDPVIAVAFAAVAFGVVLAVQLIVPRYVTCLYWLALVMVAVFGTMAADVIHVRFGVPYAVSAIGFAMVLSLILIAWYRTEGSLSIHSVDTPRRELLYWATVSATFALGTAVGDLTAYILTRPLGASFADWMGVPHSLGGLDLGRGTVSIALTIAIVGFVGYLSATGIDAADSLET